MIKNIIALVIACCTMFLGVCYTGWLTVKYDFTYFQQATELVWWLLMSIGMFMLQRKTIEKGGLVD